MEKRSVLEITQDMKESLTKLLSAISQIAKAETNLMMAIIELLELEKELERSTLD